MHISRALLPDPQQHAAYELRLPDDRLRGRVGPVPNGLRVCRIDPEQVPAVDNAADSPAAEKRPGRDLAPSDLAGCIANERPAAGLIEV